MSDRDGNGTLSVFRDGEELASALAGLFADCAQSAVAERGSFFVALAGGTTPKAAYECLGHPPLATRVSWHDTYVYFGDERCVPPDDVRSNFRTANESFLQSVGIPEKNVHRMHGEAEPHEAARAYAEILQNDMGPSPRFDLVMLGMGADGHTASLFPGTDPFTNDASLVRAVRAPDGLPRMTLTPNVLNGARRIVIATEGAAKAGTLAAVRSLPYEPIRFPIQTITPRDGTLSWYVDRAAAGT